MYQFDMILVWFQQGSEGVQRYQNSLHFKFFPNQVRGGGWSSNIIFFPNSKQSTLSQGGGSRKLWTFSTICEIFFLDCSPQWKFIILCQICMIYGILKTMETLSRKIKCDVMCKIVFRQAFYFMSSFFDHSKAERQASKKWGRLENSSKT